MSPLQLLSCEFLRNYWEQLLSRTTVNSWFRGICTKAYLGLYRTSLMQLSAKKLKAFSLLTISAENSIIDVWPSPKYASDKGAKINTTYISSDHISCNTSSNLQNKSDRHDDEELWKRTQFIMRILSNSNRLQSKYRKIRTWKISVFGHFSQVIADVNQRAKRLFPFFSLQLILIWCIMS